MCVGIRCASSVIKEKCQLWLTDIFTALWDFSCRVSIRSKFSINISTFTGLIDTLHVLQTFIDPRGWILPTVMVPWLFLPASPWGLFVVLSKMSPTANRWMVMKCGRQSITGRVLLGDFSDFAELTYVCLQWMTQNRLMDPKSNQSFWLLEQWNDKTKTVSVSFHSVSLKFGWLNICFSLYYFIFFGRRKFRCLKLYSSIQTETLAKMQPRFFCVNVCESNLCVKA